jgi:hypothetical protein
MERIFEIVRPEEKRLDSWFLMTFPCIKEHWEPEIVNCSDAKEYLILEEVNWSRLLNQDVFRGTSGLDYAPGLRPCLVSGYSTRRRLEEWKRMMFGLLKGMGGGLCGISNGRWTRM